MVSKNSSFFEKIKDYNLKGHLIIAILLFYIVLQLLYFNIRKIQINESLNNEINNYNTILENKSKEILLKNRKIDSSINRKIEIKKEIKFFLNKEQELNQLFKTENIDFIKLYYTLNETVEKLVKIEKIFETEEKTFVIMGNSKLKKSIYNFYNGLLKTKFLKNVKLLNVIEKNENNIDFKIEFNL